MTTSKLDTSAIPDHSAVFPRAESKGGWRRLTSTDEIRALGGIDPERLELACEYNARFDASSGVVIVRNGYLVAEWYENSALTTTRYDIWSCVKSFTSTAYGLLFDDCRHGKVPPEKVVDLESPAYSHIPEGYPLSDPRKERIRFRHLLSMTSGIPGEQRGIAAIPTESGVGPFEAALGHSPVKARRWPTGLWTDKLSAEPGSNWDYSDPAMAHLALAFFHLTGREMHEVLQERIFQPIGIESLVWDLQGVGAGFIGPHTNAHTGIHVCARELARFGYLMLRHGSWEGQQLVAPWWIDLATQSSQQLNPHYGLNWWVNRAGTLWPGVPRDAFAASGYMSNRCYVVPSLDLVVVRVGSGPSSWDEGTLIQKVVAAIVD